MRFIASMFFIVPFTLILAACAPVQPPQPAPLNEEQLAILQQQMLELQRTQNDTKNKLDDSQAAIKSLSAKVRVLEERQAAMSRSRIETRPTTSVQGKPDKTSTPTSKKKTAKKKKKIRRQE